MLNLVYGEKELNLYEVSFFFFVWCIKVYICRIMLGVNLYWFDNYSGFISIIGEKYAGAARGCCIFGKMEDSEQTAWQEWNVILQSKSHDLYPEVLNQLTETIWSLRSGPYW